VSAARSIAAAARAVARNKRVRALAISAGAAAARRAAPVVQREYDVWRTRRLDRDRAVKLARQMGGRLSYDTIIAGKPHIVVWKEGRPVQAFPPVEDLAARPELVGFDQRLAVEPPPPGEPRRRLPGRSR
jgi:hypothetical protein